MLFCCWQSMDFALVRFSWEEAQSASQVCDMPGPKGFSMTWTRKRMSETCSTLQRCCRRYLKMKSCCTVVWTNRFPVPLRF
jgi:hypothetical protein